MPASDKEKLEVLATIITESERLRNLALEADQGFLAYLLETALHEARANLIGAGHAMPIEAPDAAKRSRPSVVPLVLPSKPTKPR
jgi:hypothetical protein